MAKKRIAKRSVNNENCIAISFLDCFIKKNLRDCILIAAIYLDHPKISVSILHQVVVGKITPIF